MRQLFTILTFIASGHLNAQGITNGLIMPDEGFNICCYYIPSSGLKVYEQPNGKAVGELTLGTADKNNEVYDASIQLKDRKINFGYPNMEMVGYEIMAMTFKDAQSNFVKLQNGYWLDINEITSKKLKLTSWMEYIINKDTEWYANDPGLNLREYPSADSKILATLKGDLWGIKPSNEIKGNWCKVSVTHYRIHPCSGEDNLIIKTFTGWIKLISDEETPNVWHYGKGC